MKKFSSVWLIVSLFVLPCTLELENAWCILFILANWWGSFRTFKRHNPEYIND